MSCRARILSWSGTRERACGRCSPRWSPLRRGISSPKYGARAREAYPAAPYGTVLPFRRVFVVASRR